MPGRKLQWTELTLTSPLTGDQRTGATYATGWDNRGIIMYALHARLGTFLV